MEKDVTAMRVLIVEDERRLAEVLGQIMVERHWQADTVYDGAVGVDYAIMGQYDAIVLDVMLPKVDGFEVARRLRAAHVSTPILMLTARDEIPDKISGLNCGADDYMTKPFNIDELRLRMKKLLDLRGRGARRALIDPEPQSIAITSLDEKLIERAVNYVDEHMQRPDLSVEELSAELGMSRVHLYKRLKQITGKTPIEFIRVLRLKRAAQLLRESQLNISEIAYRCGFNNPKYFSRYFKEEFGVLPSVYQEKEGK